MISFWFVAPWSILSTKRAINIIYIHSLVSTVTAQCKQRSIVADKPVYPNVVMHFNAEGQVYCMHAYIYAMNF